MLARTLTVTLSLYLAVSSVAQQPHNVDWQYSIHAAIEDVEKNRLEYLEAQRQQLLHRIEKFVEKWNEFAEEYNRGTFDVGKAKELSEAFRKIERAGPWPLPKDKSRPGSR